MFLVEHRRKLVNDKQKTVNQLIEILKQYYPEVLAMFEHRDAKVCCAFIQRWPTCQQAKRARVSTLEKFFHTQGLHRRDKMSQRISVIQNTLPLAHDEAVLETHSLLAVVYVKRIAEAMKIIMDGV